MRGEALEIEHHRLQLSFCRELSAKLKFPPCAFSEAVTYDQNQQIDAAHNIGINEILRIAEIACYASPISPRNCDIVHLNIASESLDFAQDRRSEMLYIVGRRDENSKANHDLTLPDDDKGE
jgi:hypothetical protein